MSSRFLSGNETNLEALQNGTFELDVASVKLADLNNNLPCVMNDGYISERLLNVNDLNFQPLVSPFSGTFICTDVETQTQQSINETLDKINNFQNRVLDETFIDGILSVPTVKCETISDSRSDSIISMNHTNITISTPEIILNNNNITQVNDITANKFIVSGGTNIQYLLADGSTMTQSATSSNSNYYLFNNDNTSFLTPPNNGTIRYNAPNSQSTAQLVYISHITSDNIDIEIFFQNVSKINDLYIQDRENSANFIRYNITNAPTIISGYISIPVSVSSYGGTGFETFGNNTSLLISIFANTIEVDSRLSQVETKTRNQSAIVGTTVFSGIISSYGLNMNSTKITNVETPTVSTDCANKNYVDTATGSIKNYANIGFALNTTAIALTTTFVLMNPTFVSNITPIGFTMNSTGGALTYTGTLTKNFHITFTGNSNASLSTNPNLYVNTRKNGISIPGILTNISIPNNTQTWTQYSGNGIVSLSTNDIITTMIATTFGTATFLINQYSFSIIQID